MPRTMEKEFHSYGEPWPKAGIWSFSSWSPRGGRRSGDAGDAQDLQETPAHAWVGLRQLTRFDREATGYWVILGVRLGSGGLVALAAALPSALYADILQGA